MFLDHCGRFSGVVPRQLGFRGRAQDAALPALWHALPGRANEIAALNLVGESGRWMPWSVSPPRTWASLFALIPPEHENDLFDEASVKFPTATFAVLELAIDDWATLGKDVGKLVHFARPRDLDPTLGPEA